MEQTGQYSNMRHQLFHSSQLPPPSQLHLPPVHSSLSRSANTLPPIPSINTSPSSHNLRFRPVSPYAASIHNSQSSVLPPLPSPSSSQLPWPSSLHRTSNSREDTLPSQRSEPRQNLPLKRESISSQVHHQQTQQRQPSPRRASPPPPPMSQTQQQQLHKEPEDGMPSTSDFVKKLYKMLEDPSFQHVVSWGPQGDCFVVKDMNDFTKSILPRMFKHSNFASFVRQLNKYDFHKVKNTDDNQFGEHSWTFRHPDFHADRRDALENIKRKVPTQRKSLPSSQPSSNTRAISSDSPGPSSAHIETIQAHVESLESQIERMTQAQEDMTAHIRNLERNYQDVLVEMVNFQRNMAQQDGLMQNLIQYFLQVENGKIKDESINNGSSSRSAAAVGVVSNDAVMTPNLNPFLPTQEAQRMTGGTYQESDVARASLVQMNEISRRAEVAGMSFTPSSASAPSATADASDPSHSRSGVSRFMATAAGLVDGDRATILQGMSRQDALTRISELQRSRPTSAQGGSTSQTFVGSDGSFVLPSSVGGATSSNVQAETEQMIQQRWPEGVVNADGPTPHEGLQVFTVGHLLPRSSVEDDNGNWTFDPNSLGVMPSAIESSSSAVDVDASARAPAPEVVEPEPYGGEAPSPEYAVSTAGAEEVVQPTPTNPPAAQKLRVRRSTFVPGWAVPPRVLLVDDDDVSRRLSSKFLQVYGCTIDIAVDGVGAVNKMNLEKYDLVLMDIVMPKLDGVSATSLIRQFDPMTPIISMTSNSKPSDIMTYFSSGMNDILPKPFTKEGLLDMLEKHLMHLKVIQQMSKVPRSVGIPPLSNAGFQEALAVGAASLTTTSTSSNPQPMATDSNSLMAVGFGAAADDDGRINPLAGMGLTDEQYTMILQNLVNGESFIGVGLPDGFSLGMPLGGSSVSVGEKRSLEDDGDEGLRDGKRGRFEVLE